MPGVTALPAFDDDVWELYDGATDYSQARDLAGEHPEKLHELQRLWLIEAVKYNVLPLDDRTAERLEPTMAGRPTLIHGNSQLFFPGMGRLSENSVVNIKNKSFSVTAELDVSERGADGRPLRRAARTGPGRTTDTHPRHVTTLLPRYGPALGEQRRQHQEPILLGHRRGRSAPS